MPSCCAVPLCSFRDAGHHFPKDPELRKKWLLAIRRDFVPTKFSRICKRHFVESDFVMPLDSVRKNPLPMLRKGAVPSQFRWTKNTNKIDSERSDGSNSKDPLISSTLICQEYTLFEEKPILLSRDRDDIENEVSVKKADLERSDRLDLNDSSVSRTLITQEQSCHIKSKVTEKNSSKDTIISQCDNVEPVKCDSRTSTCINNSSVSD